jgi:NADPH-dependent 2,4-dienoyl-CoA reductase/sulfur reductase-like enzyme/peroxiredoxin family protein/rhodanese-related sulfurtransferase/TusA-related sulfurtransferase
MKVLIIGGVAGGATAAARLRRLNEDAQIILFEKGEYISFANCGLPYYIGGEIRQKDKLTLQTPESFHARFNVDVRIMSEVTAVHPRDKSIAVTDLQTGKSYEEHYDKLILSPGSMPIVPSFAKGIKERVFVLRNIPDTYRIKNFIDTQAPKNAVVVGGGYIGIEMAENLQRAGLDVTIVELANHVIGPIDYDMACDIHEHIRSKGVRLVLKDKVNSIQPTSSGLDIMLDREIIRADMLILSVGVSPDTSLAKEAGLEMNPRGSIVVNEHMLTSDPHIYAVGDATETTDFITGRKVFIPLAGPANKQGRIAADHINGINSRYKNTQGTAILKCFDMTVACTGINESTAQDAQIPYEKSFTYSGSHASYYPGAVSMSIKLIYEQHNGRILGVQIVGYDGVDKRCDVVATAIRANMTVHDLTQLELSYAPPFSSAKDPVNMAGYVAENILSGRARIFHWHDVPKIDLNQSSLLDVRTKYEFENGSIPGAIHIPIDELRDRLCELDQGKTYYVLCQIGLRGYIACRILSQNQFSCLNLSGGYRLYASIFGKPVISEEDDEEVSNLRREGITTEDHSQSPDFNEETQSFTISTVQVDATGLQCPGPILQLAKALNAANPEDVIEISTTDPAFISDSKAFCRRTGNTYIGLKSEKGVSLTTIRKGSKDLAGCKTSSETKTAIAPSGGNGKNIIVFSGDLDKAIASFIIANASAAMGRKVTMFFTFWGLNILRKPRKIKVQKDFLSRMFGRMMPRGSKKLSLSKMNMFGMGAKMIRGIMKKKNIDSLEELIQSALDLKVELVACTMSMDVMGIQREELIDGIQIGGAAAMIAHAEESDMSLFI